MHACAVDFAPHEDEHCIVWRASPRRRHRTQTENGGHHDATGSVSPL